MNPDDQTQTQTPANLQVVSNSAGAQSPAAAPPPQTPAGQEQYQQPGAQVSPAPSPPAPNPAQPANTDLAQPNQPGGQPAAGGPRIVAPPESKKSPGPSTQNTLQIAEIRDGIVIMKDGSLRSVVMCQSINFDLMSPNEREAVEFSYQGFLNSLYFPIQVFIRSQKVDLGSYLENLNKIRTEQDNVLLGLLMEDYIAYVRYLLETANIMDKQFFIVVPFYPSLITQEGLATNIRKFFNIFKPRETVVLNETEFAKHKTELAQRTQVILNGMSQMGVRAVPLNTQELIELYYSFYNPDTASQQSLTDVSEFDTPYVTRGQHPQPTPGGQS